MLSTDQLDTWFTYHPPTEEQKPKYAAITMKHRALADLFSIENLREERFTHDDINRELRAFVETIDAHSPDSADKVAAVRCVRIARNGLNEALVETHRVMTTGGRAHWPIALLHDTALTELLKARWQANSAIACE